MALTIKLGHKCSAYRRYLLQLAFNWYGVGKMFESAPPPPVHMSPPLVVLILHDRLS